MARGKKKPDPLPATGSPTDAPHVGRAVKGCGCMQCAVHRMAAREDARDQREARRPSTYDGPMFGTSEAPMPREDGEGSPFARGDDTRNPLERR